MELLKDIKKFIKSSEKPLIVVLGPTASGKTALSLKIAHAIDGEILSTDSRQLYKGLEIGTDALPEKKQEDIPHHMMSITSPDKLITLADYKDLSLKAIKKIYAKKHIPILVGGTGLYVSSITEGYDVPKVEPNLKLRRKLQKEAKEKGNEYVHKKLQKLDSDAAKKIHPNNIRYVIRAIEINMATGKHKVDKKKKSSFDVYMVGIEWPREALYKRIEKRVDNQIKRGLVDEVKALLDKKYDEDLPAMTSLGVKEIIPSIKGKMPIEECVEVLKRNTRHYAKRQMTWFKRYDNVKWLTPSDLEEIIK